MTNEKTKSKKPKTQKIENEKTKKQENTAEIGFEAQIWSAADKLRGNMDASEYKNVVLGLIFLKYISDKFEERHAELVAEGAGFEEDKDEYTYKNIFWVPENARWSVVSSAAHTPEVGGVIDAAMRAIEDENPKLKNILPKNYARQELDKRRLGDVVDIFTNVKMAHKGDTKDILGRTYEYCLTKFAEKEGKNAGEFFTPTCVVKTLVEVIEPFAGRVYDPCCGSGGMFVQSQKFVKNHGQKIEDISIYGQESNPTTWKMAQMNLAIRGIDASLGRANADTFFNDLHKCEKFDYILANPPFNLKDWGQEKLQNDPRWAYGTPPAGNANFAWMQHMIYHLNRHGRMGLVLANGSLSTQTSGEGDIRAKILEADLVEGIIAMPDKLFYNTGIPVCLWIISKDKAHAGKTLFVDARNLGQMVSRKLRELGDADIKKISTAFDAFRAGTFEPEQGFSAVVGLEDIKAQDYILTPGRYVGVADVADDGEPFEEKVARLTSEITDCFEESNKLQEEIMKNLQGIRLGA